ncbi:MAG: A24 family peptidase C-terminal domain-containing protein [Methanoregula sp.]|jgi:preflagellin peptidase FlaK
MELLYPMAISAVAVFATLIYASFLDIRDRRVPFVYWLPMLGVGIVCTSYLLWQTTANISLITGYLAIVVCFLYADYLDNRGRTDSPCLTRYYKKSLIFYYLAIVLILPILSWFVFASSLNIQLIPWYVMFTGILTYISYLEFKGRPGQENRRNNTRADSNIQEIIIRWYFVLIIMIFSITSVVMLFSHGSWGSPALLILLLSVFCGVFYIFARMHLFGGADAWALIFISFCIPTFPFTPLLGTPPLGFLSFSVLINALLLNLAAPLVIFIINIIRGNRAPLMYMFFGFPVNGDRIQNSWGFVMEDFTERKGIVSRKFIGFWDSIKRMYTDEGRVYTKDLREHPEEFQKELAIYKKAGIVWISYAVPFMIPITAGLITALVFGDVLFAIMKIVGGGM